MENSKNMDIASFLGVLFCVSLNVYTCILRIRQIRADAKCSWHKTEKEYEDIGTMVERAMKEEQKKLLNTPLKRILFHVPLVTADQINEGELIRLTTMQGFRD